MPIPYTKNPPYKLILADDGSFVVQPGDCLSKYNWAIRGNWGDPKTWAEFARPGTPPIRITPDKNQNLIKAGETLIYMPDYKPGKPGKGPEPKPDPAPGGGSPRVGFDITLPMYQKDSGLKEKGNFLVQMILTAQGMVSARGITVTAGDKDKLSQLIAADIAQQWVKDVDSAITFPELQGVAQAVYDYNISEFNNAMGDLVHYGSKRSFKFSNFVVTSGFRGEPSLTPVVASATFDVSGVTSLYGTPVEYAGSFSVTLKFGLSRLGWAKIIDKIGIPAVRAFVRLLGPAVAAEIAYWCGFVLLAVGATLGTLYLYEWVMEFGKPNEYAAIYARVYTDSVFRPGWFRIPQQVRGANGEEMVVAALRDVIADMQGQGLEVPNTNVPPFSGVTNDFWRPNRAALTVYKHDIVGAANGDEGTAEQRLYMAALEKAQAM